MCPSWLRIRLVKALLKPIKRNYKLPRFEHWHSSFSIIHNFLPNPGRIPPALASNGLRPLNVNAGRILPGFGRKLWIIGKLERHVLNRVVLGMIWVRFFVWFLVFPWRWRVLIKFPISTTNTKLTLISKFTYKIFCLNPGS